MADAQKVAGYVWVKISIGLGLLLGLLLLGQTVGTYRYVSRSMVRQEAQNEGDRKAQTLARAYRTASRDTAALTQEIDDLIKEAPEKIAWMRVLTTEGKVIASGGNLKGAPVWNADSLRAATGGRGPRQDFRTTDEGEVLLTVSPIARFGGRGGRGGPPTDFGRSGAQMDFSRGGSSQDTGRGGPPDRNRDRPAGARENEPGSVSAPPFAILPENTPQGFGPDGPARNGIGRAGGPSGEQGRGQGRGPSGPYVETAIYLDGVSVSFAPLLVPLGVGSTAAIALLAAVIIIGLRFPHYIQSKQYEEELLLARRVQNDLFPREGTPTGNVEFAARFIPSRQVGGDLYDVFETGDGGVAMVLGDVSGKGLSAALLMGVVQGAVRTSSDSGLATNHEYAAERLNHLLCMKTARERFVSLFWCYLNREGTRLSYINAGHLPALLVRERFGRPDVWRLEQGGGPVLGVLPTATYKQAEIDIEPGDLLVVFSDGVSEAANAAGDEFGEEGIVEAVKRDWWDSASGVCDGILADVRAFLGKMPPHDDQTLMVIRLERVPAAGQSGDEAEAGVPALS
jgi:serine phosphatase RsbU (regulator of sigma subunit)